MNLAERLPADWRKHLTAELNADYFQTLEEFVRNERETQEVYPPEEDVFSAFEATSFAATRVLILGQDPYHGPRQSHGLAFSVRSGIKVPPSLRNMYKELETDWGPPPPDGCLDGWTRQGVLLLNTVLTVRRGKPGSHQKHGWEQFTDAVLSTLSAREEPVVFVLWGNPSRKKIRLIDTERHQVIEAAHPSPLSAYRGFFGSRPFSQINAALKKFGTEEIDWSAPAGNLLRQPTLW